MAQAPTPGLPGVAAPTPQRKRRGCGCTGCLGILLLVVLLAAVGIFYFGVVGASASVAVPAELLVVTQTANVTHGGSTQAGKSGQLIRANDSIRTDSKGRAAIQFQDGSLTRLAPGTEVQLTQAQFTKHGQLQNVTLSQKAGRTYSTVQRLTGGGATFTVQGHSGNASVRGTEFEIIVSGDGTFTLRVKVGKVHLKGSTETDVSAGHQVVVQPNGKLGPQTPIPSDPADPFNLWIASENAAKGTGQPGTATTDYSSGGIASGQTQAQPDYGSAGGDLVGDLVYPGSKMKLRLVTPSGQTVESDTASLLPGVGKKVEILIPNGAPGLYHVFVTGEDVNPAEDYAVTLSVRYPCASGSLDNGGFVRNILSAKDTAAALTQAGGSNVSVNFSGASATGVNASASGSFSGVSVSGSALLYAADGFLVAQVTSATVSGISVTDQLTNALSQASGHNLTQLDPGYHLDRLYTCTAAGDAFMVIEGHHV